MPSNNDDVIIKRVKVKKDTSNSEKNDSKDSEYSEKRSEVFETQYRRHIKILAALIAVVSVLIFLALFSYTPKDTANTQISVGEFLSLIKGKEEALAKAQTTMNWLGLLGAIISNFLINSTIGYSILLFPMILLSWSSIIFVKLKPGIKLIKYTAILILYCLSFSTFMGTISRISWFNNLSREWIGSYGYFSSTLMSGILGTVGTIILILALIVLMTLVGFSISVSNITLSIKTILKRINAGLAWITNKLRSEKTKDTETPEEIGLSTKASVLSIDITDEDDPAKILIRSQEKDNAKSGKSNFGDDLLKNPLKAYSRTVKTDLTDKQIENPGIENTQDQNIDEKKNFIIKKFNKDNNSGSYITHEDAIKQKIIPDEQLDENTLDEDALIDDDFNENDIVHREVKPLVVTLDETIITVEDDEVPINLLGTSIHDEEINYKQPPIKLLVDDKGQFEIDEDELKSNAKILQEKLETFKIYIENLSVTPGPVVTQYEFVPAAGIKISRIAVLADDIAMALKAKGIRIIAPIPGKGTVGIEIPNQNPAIVRFSSCVKSSKFNNNNFKLPIALGKTISGEVFTADLSKMPHLLMAGTTGSGKSVGINTIITSLLYKMHPSNLKFVIIDPKKVELTQYVALENHFLATSPDLNNVIITDPQEAVIILKSVCAEMDLRYNILASVGQRNIDDYNRRVSEGKFKNNKELLHKQMPYIVVIIDELADLMLTASKEVETPLIRLAQLARAVGIHLVVATQRPSVDVITGIIKANFPARISYLVSSKIDSRTILDHMGAEKLLGNGDLLFQAGGSMPPIRIQNAFLSTEEVEDISAFIGKQNGYSSPYLLPSINEVKGPDNEYSREDRDPLFEDAARLIIRHQQGSVSLVQRRLKVGYARAGRIVDELEAAGIVGPYDGSKARLVLMDSESDLERVL
jgi:S-DNA-T family DNA segregation ATPase FtsK/SpoIIIE